MQGRQRFLERASAAAYLGRNGECMKRFAADGEGKAPKLSPTCLVDEFEGQEVLPARKRRTAMAAVMPS